MTNDYNPEDFDHLDDADEAAEEADTVEIEMDDANPDEAETPSVEPKANGKTRRVFKTGTVIIEEDAASAGKSVEEIRRLLMTAYPELSNAVARETTTDGVTTVEFLPQAGKKG